MVIPARLCSERLPGKVLLPLAGKPMLQHVWERARAARLSSEPIVATDSQPVADAARRFGATVVMTSSGHRCGSERVAEVAGSLSSDLIINLQADEVLIDPELIARLPGVFSDASVQMATAVAPIQDGIPLASPSLVKAVLDSHNNVLSFSRYSVPYAGPGGVAPGSPPCYGHLGVYAFRRRFLLEMYRRPQSDLERREKLEQLRVLQAGHRIRAVVWSAGHFGVNTPEDLQRVRELLEKVNYGPKVEMAWPGSKPSSCS